jgi:hypothetical protein
MPSQIPVLVCCHDRRTSRNLVLLLVQRVAMKPYRHDHSLTEDSGGVAYGGEDRSSFE